MRIRHELPSDFFDQGFTEKTDPFNRHDLAQRLTGLYKDLQQGTVSIIDGRWGSGKTVFAKQWMHHLRGEGIPSIYVDAFALDYMDSPFEAIATSLIKAARENVSSDDGRYKKFIGSVARAAKAISAPAAKAAVKAASLGIIGGAELGEFKDAVEAASDSFADASEEAIKKMLEKQSGNDAIFKELRLSLARLPDILNGKSSPLSEDSSAKSLVVLVDELDRCRPDFALGILETIKHFFHAKHIHFVLVTNVEHLLLSIKQRYGSGDTSYEYMQKFYDFIVPFTDSERRSGFSGAGRHALTLIDNLLQQNKSHDLEDFSSNIAYVITAYGLSLRQAEKLVTAALLARIDFTKNSFRPGALIAFIFAIKIIKPTLFNSVKRGNANYDDLIAFLKEGEWNGNALFNHLATMITYHSKADISSLDPEFASYAGWFARFSFHDRLNVLPFLANSIIDRYS